MLGDLDTHDRPCRRIAAETGVEVLNSRRDALPRPGPLDPRRPQPALLRHRPRRDVGELHERPVRRPARHRRPGTLRDSLIALDGLLELQPPGAGDPTMI